VASNSPSHALEERWSHRHTITLGFFLSSIRNGHPPQSSLPLQEAHPRATSDRLQLYRPVELIPTILSHPRMNGAHPTLLCGTAWSFHEH
jgi:hypothetical protein